MTPIDGRHLVFVWPNVGGASVVNAFVSIEVLNVLSTERDAKVSRYSCLILRYFNVCTYRQFVCVERHSAYVSDGSVPGRLNCRRLFVVTYLWPFLCCLVWEEL